MRASAIALSTGNTPPSISSRYYTGSLRKAKCVTRVLGSGRLDKSPQSLKGMVNIPQKSREYDGILERLSEGLYTGPRAPRDIPSPKSSL